MDARPAHMRVAFSDAVKVWAEIGLKSFGGPAGQIAVMHRVLVQERRWVEEGRFLHALNYCMILPGPEAMQLATYIGWMMHGTLGGIVAGALFVLPGFVAILTLSLVYAQFAGATLVAGLFFGLKAAVLAIVVHALLRIARRAIRNVALAVVALGALVAIFVFDVSFPFVIVGAALLGFVGGRVAPSWFEPLRATPTALTDAEDSLSAAHEGASPRALPSARRTARVALAWLALWFAPIAVLATVVGTSNVFVQESLFFSKVAVVTFGGAYAVLSYVAQQAVDVHGWLAPGEMLDGLGMAETTPGPLIMVLQFVAFMGAYRNPGTLDPLIAGVLGSVLATWVIFVPSFMFIFVGAPYLEYVRKWRSLNAALASVTAAVVGVIVNLALWFGLQVLFAEVESRTYAGVIHVLVPVAASFDPAALGLLLAALVLLFVVRLGMLRTLGLVTLAGLAYRLFSGA